MCTEYWKHATTVALGLMLGACATLDQRCVGVKPDLHPIVPAACSDDKFLGPADIHNLAFDIDAGQLNLDRRKLELEQYQCSGAYDRDVKETLKKAQDVLDRAVASNHDERAAIVLDIDETSLSNWPQMVANDFAFTTAVACNLTRQAGCGFNAWIDRAEAPPLQPTLDLFNHATKNGVQVFFVTGRSEKQRDATTRNLCRAGYAGWHELYMKPAGEKTKQFKSETRAKIETDPKTPFHILLNIGDQYSDLVGDEQSDHAAESLKVPNPFYLIP